jgi:hypothetical protein
VCTVLVSAATLSESTIPPHAHTCTNMGKAAVNEMLRYVMLCEYTVLVSAATWSESTVPSDQRREQPRYLTADKVCASVRCLLLQKTRRDQNNDVTFKKEVGLVGLVGYVELEGLVGSEGLVGIVGLAGQQGCWAYPSRGDNAVATQRCSHNAEICRRLLMSE